MKCNVEDCEGDIRVTHVYASGLVKTSRAVCEACGKVYVGLTQFEEYSGKRGAGARALIQKYRENGPSSTPED